MHDYKFLAPYNDKYLIYVNGFKYGLIDRDGNKRFELSIFDNLDDE